MEGSSGFIKRGKNYSRFADGSIRINLATTIPTVSMPANRIEPAEHNGNTNAARHDAQNATCLSEFRKIAGELNGEENGTREQGGPAWEK